LSFIAASRVGYFLAMRLDAARRFALSLPETTEEPHFEMSSFRVKGKIFTTVPVGGKCLQVRALVADDPAAFEEIVWGKRAMIDWIRVVLAKADRQQVEELLEDAWRRKAPKRVVAAFEAERQK
jgi:hypothetical protein